MNCTECEIIKIKKNIIYEDELAYAFLYDKPAVRGQIVVVPKEHFPIIERMPENVFAHLFLIASKLSTLCFELFRAHGTNILIKNGLPAGQKSTHVQVHIIPRYESDGLNIQWQPKKVSEDEMSSAESALKIEIEKSSEKQEEKEKDDKKKKEESKKEENKDEDLEYDEGNYLFKQLERLP